MGFKKNLKETLGRNTIKNVSNVGVTPGDISSLYGWYDFSDTSTINDSTTSGRVDQVDDKSGNARHAVQTLAANKVETGVNTLNGKNVLTWNGSSRYLRIADNFNPATTDFTVFIVNKYNASAKGVASNMMSTEGAAGVGRSFLAKLASEEVRSSTGGESPALRGRSASYNNATINVVDNDSGDMRIYQNGARTALEDGRVIEPNPTGDFLIGIQRNLINPMIGDMGEVIVYDRKLSDSERQQVENYLAAKWAITIERFLPTDISSVPNVLYLDALYRDTFTLSTNDISQWDDKGPSGNDASEATAAEQPLYVADGINQYPAVDFPGVDDVLILPSSTFVSSGNISIFAIFKLTRDNVAIRKQIINTTTPNNAVLEIDDANKVRGRVNNGAMDISSIISTTTLQLNQIVRIAYIYDNTSNKAELFIDGVSEGTDTAPSPVNTGSVTPRIGNITTQINGLRGLLGTLVVQNGAVTSGEVTQMNNFMKNVWETNTTFLLEETAVSPKLAIAYYKIVPKYGGNCVRIRRDSDLEERDFGYDPTTGIVAVNAIASFLGGSDGFIIRRYDQSGNSLDQTQTTDAFQPRIILNGPGGIPTHEPTILWAILDSGTVSDYKFLHDGTDHTIISGFRPTSSNPGDQFIPGSTGGNITSEVGMVLRTNDTGGIAQITGQIAKGSGSFVLQEIQNGVMDYDKDYTTISLATDYGTSYKIYQDTTNIATETTFSGSPSSADSELPYRMQANDGFQYDEILIFDSLLPDADREALVNFINNKRGA